MAILPNRSNLMGVIGGKKLSKTGVQMARALGQAILETGYKLVTGGRKGAGCLFR
jgi:predicted Rossmann fold nucleotide-binding protein DprA/Smf involved in DNA uptake